ncbi:MAG: alpha/beta hydrolase [Candidatus Rokubacteria bacterium]|nr:alpha/beta hydrolase [Candidatus Rokubacteria bacterium]
MPYATGDGLRLHYVDWPGEGPPVVGIHGLTSNCHVWDSLAEALSPAHRLLAYDLRGRGDSDKPASGYSLAHHTADLAGLLSAWGLERAVLAGHSLGAHIAVSFAHHHPERVEKLILVDGGFDVRPELLESLRPALARLGQAYPSLAAYLAMVRALPPMAGRWNAYAECYYTYDAEVAPDGTVRSKVPRAAIEEELWNLSRVRLWAYHHRIACPTLILRAPDGILGATDCLMTQEEAEALLHAIPRSRLVVVPDTNHYTILLGANPALPKAVREFLAGA